MSKRKYKYIPGEFDLVSRPSAAEIDEDGNKYWNKNSVAIEQDAQGVETYTCKYFSGFGDKSEMYKVISIRPVPRSTILKTNAQLLERALMNTLSTFMSDRQVIIGLGPGRCGTNSLAALLGAQTEVLAFHESKPRLGWYATVYEFIGKWARFFSEIPTPLPIIADVAFWYLPFVVYIMYVCPKAKFVCLRRDVEETVRSHLLKFPSTSPWNIRNGEHWNENWNFLHVSIGAYPQYDLPKEEACRRYIMEYYAIAEKYQEVYPKVFKIFPIDDLNSVAGRERILDFCGVKEKRVEDTKFVLNKTDKGHKEILRGWKAKHGEDF